MQVDRITQHLQSALHHRRNAIAMKRDGCEAEYRQYAAIARHHEYMVREHANAIIESNRVNLALTDKLNRSN